MVSRPVLLWSLFVGGVLLLVVGLGLSAEVIARSQLTNATAKVAATFPGIQVEPAAGLALGQLATGRIDVVLSMQDSVLDEIAACRTDKDVSISATAAGIVAETHHELGGTPTPVRVLLVPQRHSDGTWTLTPDSISAGGIAIPAQRAAALLGTRQGLSSMLREGIPLPTSSAGTVTSIVALDGALRIGVNLPVRVSASGPGSDLISSLSDCLNGQK